MVVDKSISLFRQFEFPLNAYALALFLEEGRVDYLHYGLSENRDEPAWQAQQRSTDLVLSRLPGVPCRLLEVGIGLGTTFQKLEKLGYAVTGITPDSHQIDAARERVGEDASLINTRFEDIKSDSKPYDFILMQESAQYINTLDLFNQAYDLLADGGELFILDEVTLRASETEADNFPLLDYVLTTAERCGFELIEKIDLSSKAIPTLDYLLRVVESHRERLIAEFGFDQQQLYSLMESNRIYKKKYMDGIYGYALLRFHKVRSLRWRVYRSSDRDFQDISNLFKSVFGQEMTPATWAWKYGDNRGQAIVARRKGKMIAHYGGISRPVLFFGKQEMFWQICDVMVHASERGVFSKRGPFFHTAASFTELFGSIYHGRGFGFPSHRAMKVAEKLNLYACVGQLVEIRWPQLSDRPHLRTRIRHLDSSRDRDHVNALWGMMSRDFQSALIGVRDWLFVEHRYLNHPSKKYDAILVRFRLQSDPVGIIVLNRDGERLELVDIIGPVKNFPLLIRQARRLAGRWKFDELCCWITKGFSKMFAQLEGAEFPTDMEIPTTIWTDGPDPDEIRGKWWLMAGDTDFR